MATATETAWAEHAHEVLREAGLRRGGARTAVIEALSGHDCAVTALDLDDELPRRKPRVGRASIYRALELFEQLGLVQRIEMTRGTAAYERVDPDGHHHHHAICRSCGRMENWAHRRRDAREPGLTQVRGSSAHGRQLCGSMGGNRVRRPALSAADQRRLPELMERAGVSGGSVYDGLVGLTAAATGAELLSLDGRAVETYARLDVAHRLVT